MRVYNAECVVCGGNNITTYLHNDPESGYVCENCGEGVRVIIKNCRSTPVAETTKASTRTLVGYRVRGKNSGVYITSADGKPLLCVVGAVPSSLHRAEAYVLAADFMKCGGDCVIVKVYLRTSK